MGNGRLLANLHSTQLLSSEQNCTAATSNGPRLALVPTSCSSVCSSEKSSEGERQVDATECEGAENAHEEHHDHEEHHLRAAALQEHERRTVR